jgi:hypothetical protein
MRENHKSRRETSGMKTNVSRTMTSDDGSGTAESSHTLTSGGSQGARAPRVCGVYDIHAR